MGVRGRMPRGSDPHYRLAVARTGPPCSRKSPSRARERAILMQVPLYQAKAEFFRMLGHPVRIRVLELLQGGPVAVRDLLSEIEIEPSSLSQQLAVLRRSGIVVSIREGSTVSYALAGGDVAELLRAARRILTELLAGQSELLAELQQADVSSVPAWHRESRRPGGRGRARSPVARGRGLLWSSGCGAGPGVVGSDDGGDCISDHGGQVLALVVGVGVDEYHQRGLLGGELGGDGLVAGQGAVVADPALDVEDAQAVAGAGDGRRWGLEALGLRGGRSAGCRWRGCGPSCAGPGGRRSSLRRPRPRRGSSRSSPRPGRRPSGRCSRGRAGRELRARREEGVRSPAGSRTFSVDVVRERLPADLLHDQPEQDQVGVAVVELRARLEQHGVLEGVVEQLLRGERAVAGRRSAP